MEEVCAVGGECKCLDARKTFPSEVGGDVVIRGNLTVFGAVGAAQVHLVNTDAYGRPIVSIVDRGTWRKDALYYHAVMNPDSGVLETSDVWHYGCRWRCMKTGTRTEPKWNSPDWLMIEGDARLEVGFEEKEQLYNLDDFKARLTLYVRLYGRNIVDELPTEAIRWSRYSESSTTGAREASDAAWTARNEHSGKSVLLRVGDLDLENGQMPQLIRFTATVRVDLGNEEKPQLRNVSFQY